MTPEHAHPFTAGEDFCLVHNGSLSNPHSVRRKLEPLGIQFETDNDTEAACRFLEWRMREGDEPRRRRCEKGFDELDGFFTFLMGTRDEMALVRDAFSCKPAMVAETDDYVAISSEFRSLANLPGVKHANIFEPKPEQVYSMESVTSISTWRTEQAAARGQSSSCTLRATDADRCETCARTSPEPRRRAQHRRGRQRADRRRNRRARRLLRRPA